MNICIIPARGGSKRIPRKNIKDFCGKPMIEWAISSAKASKCFSHIVVSTEDREICEISLRAGAEVPFIRPTHLAGDHTTTRAVVNNAIENIRDIYGFPEYICCLYPTNPLLSPSDIRGALDILKSSEDAFVFSAAEYTYPVQRSFYVDNNGKAKRLCPEHRYTRSQDLVRLYHDAGQFYWGRTDAFLKHKDPVSEEGRPYLIHPERVQDIDTVQDWERAEVLFKVLTRRNGQ